MIQTIFLQYTCIGNIFPGCFKENVQITIIIHTTTPDYISHLHIITS